MLRTSRPRVRAALPMRLLPGDAGSGRTVAALIVIDNGAPAVIRFDPLAHDREVSGSGRTETAKCLDPHGRPGGGDGRRAIRGIEPRPRTRTEEARADVVRTLSSVSKGRILLADPKGEECLATPRSGTRLAEWRAVAVPPGGPTGTTRRSPYPRFGVCEGPLALGRAVSPVASRSSLAGRNRPDRPCRSPGRALPPTAESSRARTPEPRKRADVVRALSSVPKGRILLALLSR